jgi:hypothetical protein
MSSPTNEKLSGDLKAALEAIAGHKIEASPEQLQQQIIGTPLPFSNYFFTPPPAGPTPPFQTNAGEVVSRNPFVGTIPPLCSGFELLDVGGLAWTSDAGNATLLIKNFICPQESARLYFEPVITVATPASAKPSFLTVTHSLVVDPAGNATNVQINIFSWDINGAPAPDLPVNFRCRVPTRTFGAGPFIK